MTDTCFFCTTPYQVVAAICLTINESVKPDIYIVNQFRQAKELTERLKAEKLFNNVVYVDEKSIRSKYLTAKSSLGMSIQLAFNYFRVTKIANRILLPNVDYSRIFVSTKAYTARFAYLSLLKRKVRVELVYFDDGEGSYDNPNTYGLNPLDYCIRRVLFGRESVLPHRTTYLYSPELYYSINPDSQETIQPLPCLWSDERIKEIIRRLFCVTPEVLIQEPVVFIDTIHDGMKKDVDITSENALTLLMDRFGTKNVIIKKHPRDLTEGKKEYKYYPFNSIPIEALCAEMDMDKKVMVIIQSTSAAMPKILLDKEPYIILLYRMLDNWSPGGLADIFYEGCRKMYRSSNRFFIPENYHELKEAVELIAGEMNRQNGSNEQ